LNADILIRDNFDPHSNVTEESDLHSEKHITPMISIDAGRMISIKPVRKNACSSIRDNIEPDSNVIEESDLHSEKHLTPKISTDAGIMISIKSV
jgi:microcystin degradation protein MlrC